MSASILLAPVLPLPWLAAAVGIGLVLCAITVVRRGRGAIPRAAALALLALAAVDPRLVREQRTPNGDVALIVSDHSPSQTVGERGAVRDAAAAELAARLGRLANLDVRTITIGDARGEQATRAFAAAERAIAEHGADRLAALFVLTDGQIHDIPPAGKAPPWLRAPVHVLLTGAPAERDRRVVVEQSPAYGVVGTTASVRYRIEDLGVPAQSPPSRVPIRFRVGSGMTGTALATTGRSETLSFALDRAGPIAVEIEVDPLAGEVSPRNNRAAAVINGVRDRLRVLLVSGQPHLGERTWRNLLKSDPAVDLVHFTILRPPEKDEPTPLHELSLIVFPVQELFENRLNDFDLIVFDRYGERGVLADTYFEAIGRYLERGGAVLIASGPEYAGPMSLAHTSLGRVLPAAPTGRTIERAFVPTVTGIGRRHPVTSALPAGVGGGAAPDAAVDEGAVGEGRASGWGRWFRLIEADAGRGSVLMTGADGRPLLITDRLGEGRIGQLMSDQIWLWARGFEGGGPYVELVRRLAHWLMKEPELEEDGVKAMVADGRLRVERRSLGPAAPAVRITTPAGDSRDLPLVANGDGPAVGSIEADEPGLYRIEADNHTTVAIAGGIDLPEFADLRASAEQLAPLAASTGGGVFWLRDGLPEIREITRGRIAAGRGWMGLQRNQSLVITGTTETPLLPGLLLAALALGTLMLAWWREGR